MKIKGNEGNNGSRHEGGMHTEASQGVLGRRIKGAVKLFGAATAAFFSLDLIFHFTTLTYLGLSKLAGAVSSVVLLSGGAITVPHAWNEARTGKKHSFSGAELD